MKTLTLKGIEMIYTEKDSKKVCLSIEEILSMFECAINCRVVRCVELSGDVFKLIFENGDTIGEIQFKDNNEFMRFCDAQKEAKCA